MDSARQYSQFQYDLGRYSLKKLVDRDLLLPAAGHVVRLEAHVLDELLDDDGAGDAESEVPSMTHVRSSHVPLLYHASSRTRLLIRVYVDL